MTTEDHYGRKVPKHAHGSENLSRQTSSERLITDAALKLYERCVDPKLTIRRITIGANRLVEESMAAPAAEAEQLDLFTDYAAIQVQHEQEENFLRKERDIQKAVLDIKRRFGKNAILKASSLQEGSTAKQRNEQIGGHKS